MPRRVLIVSDRHPLNFGGVTQLASYRLYEALNSLPDTEAYFLASAVGADNIPLGIALFQPFGENEYLIATSGYDSYLATNWDTNFSEHFAAIVRRVRPDIVYFRDCTMIGVEAIALARRLSPDATILTALRPFFAGQVRQRSDGKIYRQSNDDFIRDTVVGRFFRAADLMTVPDEAMLPLAGPARLPPGRLHVLPEACLSLPGPVQLPPRDQIVIGLFGRAQLQSVSEIVARMLRILNCGDRLRVELFPISGEANELPPADDGLHIHPPCNAADIGLYMQECDLLLLADEDPTWSAIMVQEARAAGRPVACSQSSPVARSIVDGVDGFTFAASTAAALAGLMADLIEQPHLVRSTWQQLKPPVMPIEAAAHILASCEAFEKRSLEMLSL